MLLSKVDMLYSARDVRTVKARWYHTRCSLLRMYVCIIVQAWYFLFRPIRNNTPLIKDCIRMAAISSFKSKKKKEKKKKELSVKKKKKTTNN